MEILASRLVLERRLAVGGMSEVYLARQEDGLVVRRRVVVKRILPEHQDDHELRTMFFDEARLLASLSHRGLVSVVGVVSGEPPAIVLEHVDGVTLRVALDRLTESARRPTTAQALAVGLSLAEALAYVQSARDHLGRPLSAVHRDLHPGNAMISRAGCVKLIDFGIAKAASAVHETATGVVKGTDGYMAPEQALGTPVDASADVYSLGVLLYEMLTGLHPFAGASGLELVRRITKSDVTPPSSLTHDGGEEIDGLVRACMRHDPRARPTMSAVVDGIARVLARRGVVPTDALLAALVPPDDLSPPPSAEPRTVRRAPG